VDKAERNTACGRNVQHEAAKISTVRQREGIVRPHPLPNRVDPFGRIVAVTARGRFMGNRGGVLHDDSYRIVRNHASQTWITCSLEFKGRRRSVMSPGAYTELFFLDEFTALAAGHRPCFECRRQDANAFAEALTHAAGSPTRLRAPQIDAMLRPWRGPGRQTWTAKVSCLPEGAMVVLDDDPHLVVDGHVRPWSFTGYGRAREAPAQPLVVLTPPPTVAALRAGYRPDGFPPPQNRSKRT
jgi:hypothetical protein